MNTVTTISAHESQPVEIGGFTLWCEGFKASAVRSFREEALVNGGEVITNTCPRAMKLTFSGRIFSGGGLESVKIISDMLLSGQSYEVTYKGLFFSQCRVQSFNIEDNSNDFIQAVVTLITAEQVGEEVDEQ